MTDRAKKITELTAITAPASTDLLIIETDPSGNAITKKITLQNLLNAGYITSNAYQVANTSSSGVIKVGEFLSVNATGHLNVTLPTANVTNPGLVKVGDQLSVNADGFLNANLRSANTTSSGVIKVGDQLTINATGFLNANLTSANTTSSGVIKVGNQLSINSTGFLSAAINRANTTVVGVIAVGDQLTADEVGVLSANINIANTTSAGVIKVGTNLSVNATGFLNNDLTLPASGVQRVTTSGTTSANLSAKVIFCNPNVATANITIELPNTGISDGREYIVKNINDGGNIVTIVVPGLQIEGASGLGSNAVLSNTGYTGHWVWDETSTVYRAINIYTP